MDKGTLEFIEKLGLLFEAQGTSRSAGRIAGWLLVSEEPQTLDQIAEGLDISKASVSTNTRFLESVAMIEKVSIRGDRKVYYRVVDDFWVMMLRASTGKIQAFINLAREGRQLVRKTNVIAQKRLERMEKAYSMLQVEIAHWVKRLESELKKIEIPEKSPEGDRS